MLSTAWTNGEPFFVCSGGECGGAWHSAAPMDDELADFPSGPCAALRR